MDAGKISIRYAKALYRFAVKNGEESIVYRQLSIMEENLRKISSYKTYFESPNLNTKKKNELLRIFLEEEPCKTLARFFEFLNEQHRENSIHYICLSYFDIYQEEKNIAVCNLYSVIPFDDNEMEQLKTILQKDDNRTIVINIISEPSLIGGFVLEIDKRRMDASVKHELNEIKKSLILE